jgi:EmrB/QacA subfamily drug resistance transporter
VTDSSASGAHAAPTDTAAAWKTLIAVAIGSFMTILDTTVVNVAIHSLQQQYGATTSQVQWVISVYALALGIATPLAGQLGDRFGGKKVYLVSLTAFVLASLLCGLAPTLPVLIAARAAQGLAGGFALPLGSARLFTAFPPHRRGFAFGVFGVVLVFAPTIGPLVGGALIDVGLRSWIFFINVPIGALGLMLGARFLTADQANGSTAHRVGLLSVVLTCLGFGGILLSASLPGIPAIPGGRTITLAAFASGALALAVLAAIELRRDTPLLNLRLFRIPTYSIGTTLNGIGQVAFFGIQFLLPLSLQVVRGVSALDTGLTLLPLAISSGVTGVLAGQVRDRLGPRLPLTIGFLLLAAGIALLRMQIASNALWAMVGALIVAGAGAGVIPPTTQVAALSDVRIEDVNGGTSLLQAIQRVCQALSVAVLATVIARMVTTPVTSPQYPVQYSAGLADAYAVAVCVAMGCAVLAAFLPGWPADWNARGKTPTGAHQFAASRQVHNSKEQHSE